MVEVFPLVGLILSAVAFFVDIAFSFSPVWWYYRKDETSGSTTKINAGLWRYCEKSETTERCEDHTDDNYRCAETRMYDQAINKQWMHIRVPLKTRWCSKEQICRLRNIATVFVGAAQVFQCLAFLLLVATIVFIVLKMFVLKDKSFLMPLAIAHALWAGLCLIGSAAAFGRGITKLNLLGNSHFSLAFAVISGILALAAGVVLLLDVDVIKSKLPIKADKINHSEK